MRGTSAVDSDGTLHGVVADRGAELVSLRTAGGAEVLWDGGPQWPWHAPVLFPVIGRSEGDRIRHRGRTWAMPRHGLARHQDFLPTPEGHVLTADAGRDDFPFPFRLTVRHVIRRGELVASYRVDNPGDEPLPFALGVHPAFRWPGPGVAEIVFEQPETDPVRRVTDVLLGPEYYPTPVDGCQFPLGPAVFEDGAVIFDSLRSRRVDFTAPGAPVITLTLRDGFDRLAIWSPGDAGLLCIEPWAGLPCPQGYDGEFTARPGLEVLPPNGSRTFAYSVTVR